MIARFIAVTVLVTVGFQPLYAAVYRGPGSHSCGSWTEDKATETSHHTNRFDDESWVMGFLSGYNAYAMTGDADIAQGVSARDIFKWLDNYCASHPLDLIGTGVDALIHELHQRNSGR
jgi:hypothetical protein